MALPIDVIGIGADGPASLRAELVERIRVADFLAGGERHLAFFPQAGETRFLIKNNLDGLTEALGKHRGKRCVVLASGDPLFYGVGHYLLQQMGRESLRIEPGVSSMQLAFARAGLSWEGASFATIHGRDLRTTLLPLLGRGLIGLFTQGGDSPAAVASFFLERDLDDYEAFVGENLGAPGESSTRWSDLTKLRNQRFAPLNYLILRRVGMRRDPYYTELLRSMVPGAPDGCFLPSPDMPHMLTRREVRSAVLGQLLRRLKTGDVVWDIGAGLGSVAIEMAVLRSEVEVVAVECDPQRTTQLRKNREMFGAWNVRLIEGKAPEALASETLPPCGVFIGGSGGHLGGILDFVRERLQPLGSFVANFVTLEHLALTLERLKSWHWPVEVTELHVSNGDMLANLTSLKPQRPVFIVRAEKRNREVRVD